MGKIIGWIVVGIAAYAAYSAYTAVTDGSARLNAMNNAEAVLGEARRAQSTSARSGAVSRALQQQINAVDSELRAVKSDGDRNVAELKRLTSALSDQLKSLRTALPDPTPASPPLGPGLRPIPPPPVLGGGDPVRPPIAAAPPAPATPAPAAPSDSRCAMDAYARNTLAHWCRALAHPRPSQCECVAAN